MTGYTVHYSSNGVTNSVSGLSSTSTSHDITGLTGGRTYSISVEATTLHLSGESETMTIVLGECFFSDIKFESNGLESSTDHTLYMYIHTQNSKVLYILTHTVQPPAAPMGVSVSEVQPHSVRVSWQAVEGADTYNVTFTQTTGTEQQGLCSAAHSVSVSTEGPSLSVVVGENDMLRAFTTYSITVTALSDVCSSEDSQPVTVTTAQTSMRCIIIHHRGVVTVCVLSLPQVPWQI